MTQEWIPIILMVHYMYYIKISLSVVVADVMSCAGYEAFLDFLNFVDFPAHAGVQLKWKAATLRGLIPGDQNVIWYVDSQHASS